MKKKIKKIRHFSKCEKEIIKILQFTITKQNTKEHYILHAHMISLQN